jgi:hypothetical protein
MECSQKYCEDRDRKRQDQRDSLPLKLKWDDHPEVVRREYIRKSSRSLHPAKIK